MRRAADIGGVLDRIGGGVDEGHGVGADRDHREVLWSGEKPMPWTSNLALVERAEIARLRIAEADDAEQLVVDGIGDRNGVGELLGGIDAVAMADRNIGIGCRPGAWPAQAAVWPAKQTPASKPALDTQLFIEHSCRYRATNGT